ncbi:MAG: FAD-dependent protein [Oscillospiraceae bacterium]
MEPSCRPGVFWGDLRCVLPEVVSASMAEALPLLGRKLHGFDAPDAVLTGPETRSSSPVRIPRDGTLCSAVRGLYPCGEGAGWAGGITSAAVDGMKCAEAVIAALGA